MTNYTGMECKQQHIDVLEDRQDFSAHMHHIIILYGHQSMLTFK